MDANLFLFQEEIKEKQELGFGVEVPI